MKEGREGERKQGTGGGREDEPTVGFVNELELQVKIT